MGATSRLPCVVCPRVVQLTRDCIGGNAKTLVLVHMSPCERDEDETLRTLKFVHKLKVWPRVCMCVRSPDVQICVGLQWANGMLLCLCAWSSALPWYVCVKRP